MHLRKILLALFIASMSPMASAMSLGEGKILSHVGEPFSASIALIGSYSRDVRFSQVKNAECRSSIIANSANGCDSLYEGPLTFSVRQRPDGQYFVRVAGEKGSELFYRILIKSVSADSGTVFNAFEFLPEFRETQDPSATTTNDVVISSGLSGGKYGDVGGKVIAADKVTSAKKAARQVVAHPVKTGLPDELKQKRSVRTEDASATKAVVTRLQIKKTGEYEDDIHALQKENGEIEEQIVLLEKHIALLKEVIRLKNQVDGSMAAESAVVAPAHIPVPAPLPAHVQPDKASNEPGMLSWVLLAVVLVLSALLWWMYRKQEKLKIHSVGDSTTMAPALNERKSLDLTDAFVKPKW
jgi:hypothetical protein